jgi:hypothetical protein
LVQWREGGCYASVDVVAEVPSEPKDPFAVASVTALTWGTYMLSG